MINSISNCIRALVKLGVRPSSLHRESILIKTNAGIHKSALRMK